ncbi:MAG: hypothetical protein ACKVZ0_06285 [Gemmatimonadales bacterium]
MKASLISSVLLLAACSNGAVSTGPSESVALPPAEANRNTFEGTESCAVGLVKAEVELLDDDATLFYRGGALVRIRIDGRIHQAGRPTRFLVDGREGGAELLSTATVVEIYAALGGECDWIAASRIR